MKLCVFYNWLERLAILAECSSVQSVTTERGTVFISQVSPLLNGKEPFFA